MKANAGGNCTPEEIYGRNALIDHLWRILEKQSIVITAERRIGKTQVLRRMHAIPARGWKPIFRVLDQFNTALEFAESVYDEVQQFLDSPQRAKNFLQRLLEKSETDYINVRSRTWKQLLNAAVRDLIANDLPERPVFLWDEFPWMLQNICRREGLETAAELLGTLHSLCIEHDRFRVILTGSIGLHHLLEKMSAAGIPTPALNIMYATTVPTLDRADAISLAADLLDGEGIRCDDRRQVAEAIAAEVDDFPYYIHHVAANLRLRQTPVNVVDVDTVKKFIAEQLVAASDPWNLAHYRKRLTAYYPNGNDARNTAIILDVMASTPAAECSLPVDAILRQASDRVATLRDRDDLLRLLRNLDADHYLSRCPSGEYRFRFPLIRRWWILDRGL